MMNLFRDKYYSATPNGNSKATGCTEQTLIVYTKIPGSPSEWLCERLDDLRSLRHPGIGAAPLFPEAIAAPGIAAPVPMDTAESAIPWE